MGPWLSLLRRPAVREELLWLVAIAAAVMAASVAGVDAMPATVLGLAVYAGWHLLQALRLLVFMLGDSAQGAAWVWGVWREVFDQVRRTKRRERKRKRRQQRFYSRFRKAVSVMPDAVIVLGGDGEVSWLNRQARIYFGLSGGTTAGRKLTELVDSPVLRDYLESGNYRKALEVEAPGDPTLVLSISLSRFKRRRQRYLLVARDITRLYYLNQAQRDFTLNVSHELRTPLTVLNGYLETLFEAEAEGSPRRQPLLRMIEQARRMRDVIQDLSMSARLEDGAEPLRSEPVAVYELLESIVAEGRELGRESQHTLTLEGDADLVLLGDETLLRSAFSNLIFNAVRHTPMRTRIDVTWGREGKQAVLAVRDDGTGIAARHLPRLTERFYRVDPGRSRDAGGTGLGLALVRQILDLHDADLMIQSEEGRGSVFACRFPAERLRAFSDAAAVGKEIQGPR